MRPTLDDLSSLRAAPEQLARWALETPIPAQEATLCALAFLAHTEHAGSTLLNVVDVLLSERATEDSDGFQRLSRAAVEHFRHRSTRAMAWMELLVFFRERFPAAARAPLPPTLTNLARTFTVHAGELEAAVDLLVRESVVPEIEDLLQRALTYPPLQSLLARLREGDVARSQETRRFASEALGELSGQRVWKVRRRLIGQSTKAILGSRPLLDALERGGLKVDRARAAKGFARRLEEAVVGLRGTRVIPTAILARLAGRLERQPGETGRDPDLARDPEESAHQEPQH